MTSTLAKAGRVTAAKLASRVLPAVDEAATL
jgi:hypothetical protein